MLISSIISTSVFLILCRRSFDMAMVSISKIDFFVTPGLQPAYVKYVLPPTLSAEIPVGVTTWARRPCSRSSLTIARRTVDLPVPAPPV